MSKPTFAYDHRLPFSRGEMLELLELARIAMTYQPVRQRLMNECGATDVHLSVLQKKVTEYQLKVGR